MGTFDILNPFRDQAPYEAPKKPDKTLDVSKALSSGGLAVESSGGGTQYFDFTTGKTYTPQPTVTPNPTNAGASLSGTMATQKPVQPAPQPKLQPQAQPQGQQPQGTPATPGTPIQSAQPSALNMSQFASYLDTMKTKLSEQNQLVDERNLVYTALYDRPLNQDEISKLSPGVQKALQSGDKSILEQTARILSDTLAGRTSSLNKSVEYLTNAYQQDLERADSQRQEAINNVMQFAQTYGSGAKQALASLYGDQYVEQLKSQGIDLDAFVSLPTLQEKKDNSTGSGVGTGVVAIVDSPTDQKVKAIIAANPGEWGKAADAIDQEFGAGTATKYDDWLKAVYQDGQDINTVANGSKDITREFQSVSARLTGPQRKNAEAVFNGYMNSGDVESAQQYVDSLAFDKLTGGQKTDYGVYSDAEAVLTPLLDNFEQFKVTNAGPYKTALEKAKPYATLKKDQKFVTLMGQIETAQAQVRRGLFGTALTGTEKASADNFLITDTDDIQTLETKLKGLLSLSSRVKARLINQAKGNFSSTTAKTPTTSGGGSYDDYLKAVGH